VVTAPRRRRRGLLQGAILEELLPIDLARRLLGFGAPLPDGAVLQPTRLDVAAIGAELAATGVPPIIGGPRFLLGFFLGRKDGIAIQFLPDLIDQLEPRELQKADRLLQLRGHDELLRQTKLLLEFHLLRRASRPIPRNAFLVTK